MITSDAALQAVLRLAISHAIDDVFTWAERELIKTIYEVGASTGGGGLEVAWVKEVHGMFGQLRHDPNLMTLQASVGKHGSPYDDSWRDVRDIFANIIEGGYNAWNARADNHPIPPRRFWDTFMNRFNSQFPKKFRTALRKQGLVVF